MTVDPLVVAQIVVAAAQDLLFALAAGALACGVLLSRGERTADTAGCLNPRLPGILAGLGSVRFGSLCALALACCLYLWLEAAIMSGSSFSMAAPAVGAVLTQSHFGLAWSIGCVGAVVACLAGKREKRMSWWIAALGMLLYVAGKAAASHAADAGDFTQREAIHVVHLAATALWAGSVIVAAPVVYFSRDAFATAPMEHDAFCTRLSHLATMALAVVIATGIYNAAQDMAHLKTPLLSALYGQVLILKLVFVTLAVLLGGCNRMIYLPRLQRASTNPNAAYRDAQRKFDRLLAVEAIVMVAVLIAAGVLGHTSPTGG